MRPLRALCVVVSLAACGSPHARQASPSFAGSWQVSSRRASGDTVVGYRLDAAADSTGWRLRFPGRDPMPVRIEALGDDSVAGQVAPYESMLRPGVQVRTSFVLHLRGDSLIGSTVARYSVQGPDSVLVLSNIGLRLH